MEGMKNNSGPLALGTISSVSEVKKRLVGSFCHFIKQEIADNPNSVRECAQLRDVIDKLGKVYNLPPGDDLLVMCRPLLSTFVEHGFYSTITGQPHPAHTGSKDVAQRVGTGVSAAGITGAFFNYANPNQQMTASQFKPPHQQQQQQHHQQQQHVTANNTAVNEFLLANSRNQQHPTFTESDWPWAPDEMNFVFMNNQGVVQQQHQQQHQQQQQPHQQQQQHSNMVNFTNPVTTNSNNNISMVVPNNTSANINPNAFGPLEPTPPAPPKPKRRPPDTQTVDLSKERGCHVCDVCGIVCATRGTLTAHNRNVHLKLKPFACDQCPKAFAKKSDWRNHLMTHSDSYRFACEKCGKKFKVKSNYNRHKEYVHQKTKVHRCAHCGIKISRKADFDAHVADCAGGESDSDLYACDDCGQVFNKESRLEAHRVAAHQTERPYQCEECDSSFKIKEKLKRHQDSVHAKTRRFKCPMCPMAFFAAFHLQRHMDGHNSQYDHECQMCGWTSRQKSAITKHEAEVHNRSDCLPNQNVSMVVPPSANNNNQNNNNNSNNNNSLPTQVPSISMLPQIQQQIPQIPTHHPASMINIMSSH